MREGFDGIWVSLVKHKLINNPELIGLFRMYVFPMKQKCYTQIGGEVWRVKRGSDPAWFSEYAQFNVESIDVSVNGSITQAKFTKVFENDTTIQGLKDLAQDLSSA